ncbi:MAG: sulfotransferase [Gammaproteobacteria bacterium]|nr:sulfotransferase [Gammaproteobacteria bacterium]MBQ0838661.1 sulfotransferase [Gammaproteobacteria bacterium]
MSEQQISGSKLKAPIFIVGAPRSGTTLLQYMLRSHPSITIPTGESHFFIPLFRQESEYGDLRQINNIRRVLERMYQQSAHFLDTDLHGIKFDIEKLANTLHQQQPSSMAQLIAALFELNAAGENALRWGEKTPYYVLHMKLLLDKFPGAQFIHLIRDGRDCALSMFERKHDFRVYNTFFAAKYWEMYVEIGKETGREIGTANYHEIRYEDLLENPKTVMASICHFLGEDYSDSLVNFEKSGEAGKTPLLQKPIQKSNQAKWRNQMTPKQIRMFDRTVADSLRNCNYPVTTDAEALSLPIKAFWHLHNRLLTRYYKWRLPR